MRKPNISNHFVSLIKDWLKEKSRRSFHCQVKTCGKVALKFIYTGTFVE